MKRTAHINRQVMNAVLPPVPEDFERDMRSLILSMPAEQTEKRSSPMKRKLSVGFILVCVLILLTATALAAALLGGREFVEKIMVPQATQTDSDSYTKEEIAEILRIARENDLALSEEDMYILTHLDESGYYKEELMRRFVKTEYGFYPDAWPIEVQRWYEQMLIALGLQEGPQVNVLPEGEEFTQEQILKIAQDFIHEKYDPDVNLDDPEQYIRFLTYRESSLDGGARARQWSLLYEARDLYSADYSLTLDTAGRITRAYSVEGILGASWEAHGQFMRDRFTRVYGDQYGFINWDSEILLKYQEAMRRRQTLSGPENFLSEEYPILDMTYLLPDESVISKAEAIQLAKEACGSLDYETLYSNSQVAVLMEAEGRPVWKATLRLQGGGFVFAQLDAKNGGALIIDTTKSGVYRAWRQYVTEEYWQENKPADRAEGEEAAPAWRLPAFWGDTRLAPQWYWDRLNAVGYSEETEDALFQSWLRDYGSDEAFWPLEAQAIETLTQMGDEPDLQIWDFPGLPSEEDISREDALKIAKAAFKEEYAAALPTLDASTLKGAFSFLFRYTWEDRHSWVVHLYRPDGVKAGMVWIESKTGEVYQLESTDPGAPGLRSRETSFSQPIAAPAPQEDGKPWMWGMDFAPEAYWRKMEQVMNEWGVTAENFEEKNREWLAQWGDEIFLPYDCQAMASLLAGYNTEKWAEEKPDLILFPQDGKITREQAEEIAWKALHEAGDGETGPQWINELKCNPLLWQNPYIDGLYQSEKPLWCVFFFTWDTTYQYWAQNASVYLTEEGEVVLAQLELGGNG